MKINKKRRVAAAITLMLPVQVYAQSIDLGDIDLSIGGFIRADYGNGDRYPLDQGEDRMGVTKSALAVTAEHENVKGVFVVGTEVTSEADGTTDGNVDIKDAFIEISNLGGAGITLSAGVQPILFGLKPNGYPDDHTIQGSVEYGGGGGLPVARQAGPSIIANADIGAINLRGGFFDVDSGTSASLSDNGSSITDNYFVQASAKDIIGTGFYGVLGYESIFVDAVNDGEAITSIGLGWTNDIVDISAERITLDQAVNNTADEESYTVIEASIKPSEKSNIYADYSEADEAGIDTLRTGFNYDYNKHTMFTVEYSKDRFEFGDNIKSIDFRITFTF